jgi:hypothetical protein
VELRVELPLIYINTVDLFFFKEIADEKVKALDMPSVS